MAVAGRAKDRLIEDTDVAARALCLPAFMDNMLQQIRPIRSQGAFFYPVPGDVKLPTCATRDIATVAADLLLDRSWHGRQDIPLLGPEDLSYDDKAKIITEVLGRPVRYQQVPVEAFTSSLLSNGMSQAWADGLAGLLTSSDQGLFGAGGRTGGDAREPGPAATPTTFRQWCEEVFKPAFDAAT